MKRFFLSAALISTTASALAGPAIDHAKAHFDAVGSGDVARITGTYAENAQFNWIGGPLDGTYNGVENIRGVWEKFSKAQGILKVSVDKLEEAVNPKGATITANVLFEGRQPIKVRYILTYRESKLVSETWQIDPKLALAGSY